MQTVLRAGHRAGHSYKIYITICISYILGMGALPDIYTHDCPGTHSAFMIASAYISEDKSAWVITNMLHFLDS